MRSETYLGDGLYASFDGFMITLRAPREGGSHYAALEPDVLEAFERFVAQLRAARMSAGGGKEIPLRASNVQWNREEQAGFLEPASLFISCERHGLVPDMAWMNHKCYACEIERLTARCAELEKQLGIGVQSQFDEGVRYEKELARLRGALEQIAANDHMTSPHPAGPAGVNAGLKINAELARAALSAGEEHGS